MDAYTVEDVINLAVAPPRDVSEVAEWMTGLSAIGIEMAMATLLGRRLADLTDRRLGFGEGLKALEETFHCGRTKAQEIKNSGVIDGAIHQEARGCGFLVDKDEALRLYLRHYPGARLKRSKDIEYDETIYKRPSIAHK